MYLKQILDNIGDQCNDTTLKSTGTNAARTKQWVQEFYYMDLPTRHAWSFAKKEDTVATTSGTARYNFPRWVDTPAKVEAIIHPTTLEPLTRDREVVLKSRFNPATVDTPQYYSVGPRVRTSYATGTVSATSGTKVITGNSTSWSSSTINQYDLIRVGSYVYTIDSVDSTTQLTVFEDIITTISAGTTYIVYIDRWTFDLYPTPDATLSLGIRGQSSFPRLDDDGDVPILPDSWHHILVKAGVVRALRHNNDDVTAEMQDLELAIRRMISEDGKAADYLETISIPRSRTH